MSELSKNQVAVMEHTASRSGNWFATSLGCEDSNDFEELVKLGYAISEKAASRMGDDVIYRLTIKGKRFLKTRGVMIIFTEGIRDG